jgi:pimeloyl-ACP methyl ester carboxylesterase/DNA-binding SARP family transcriptional activator
MVVAMPQAPRSKPPTPAAQALELQVFGVPRLLVNGREIKLPLKRAHALLVYLAFNGEPLPRAHLAAVLWPDADEALGRTRLRRLLYTLEQAMPANIWLADSEHLALARDALATDALEFAQFARRVVTAPDWNETTLNESLQWARLARRPLLQGIAFGSEVFDDWLRAIVIEHEHLLMRLLERVIDALALRGHYSPAHELAEALIALDTFREPSYVLLMQLHAQQGHHAGVEASYARCADQLRAEFGIRPSPSTEDAYLRLTQDLRQPAASAAQRRSIHFAEAEHGAVAYTVLGSADQAIVISPGFVCHIEIALEYAPFRAALEALAQRFKVLLFDRRGIGLSERLRATGTPAAIAADIAAILDHAGIRKAWLFGSSEGGLGAMQLAIDQPHRVEGLCLFSTLARGSFATDYPWALPPAAYQVWLQRLTAGWGGPVSIETFAPSEKENPALRAWWARLLRHAASPGTLETVLGGLRNADIRADLHRIHVPTLVMHRRGDLAVRFEAGQHLAAHIPGAQWLPLDGADHFWWCGDSGPVVGAIVDFAARQRPGQPLVGA